MTLEDVGGSAPWTVSLPSPERKPWDRAKKGNQRNLVVVAVFARSHDAAF